MLAVVEKVEPIKAVVPLAVVASGVMEQLVLEEMVA
jgi:hypothetical protein